MDQSQQHKVFVFPICHLSNIIMSEALFIYLEPFQLPHNLNNQSAADEEWDRWDDGPTEVVVGTAAARPNSVEDHIRAYREELLWKLCRFGQIANVENYTKLEGKCPNRDLRRSIVLIVHNL